MSFVDATLVGFTSGSTDVLGEGLLLCWLIGASPTLGAVAVGVGAVGRSSAPAMINAVLFKRTGRLAPAVAAHVAYNAVVLTLAA